jgi:hypothetical protein
VNLGYLALVIPGLLGASLGFVMLGRRKFHGFLSGAVFVAGMALLVLGVLLTCVPGFFRG